MGDLASFRNGLNYSANDVGSGLKIIGVADFQHHMTINYEQLQQVRGFDDIPSDDLLKDDDLLFVRSNGNRALIGRVLHIRNVHERLGHSGFTIRARITSNELNPQFAALYFTSETAKEQIARNGGGTNISNLSQDILADVTIPVPPLAEQTAIAAVLSAWDRAIERTAS